MAQDIRHEPADIPDLVGYWDQRADDYEQDRLRCIADHNYVAASYYMGRVDMARSAAGELRGMLGSEPDRTLDDHHDHLCDYTCADPRDEEAAAIERLDGHKFRGDTSVLMAGR